MPGASTNACPLLQPGGHGGSSLLRADAPRQCDLPCWHSLIAAWHHHPHPAPLPAAITPGVLRDRKGWRLGGSANPKVLGAMFEMFLGLEPLDQDGKLAVGEGLLWCANGFRWASCWAGEVLGWGQGANGVRALAPAPPVQPAAGCTRDAERALCPARCLVWARAATLVPHAHCPCPSHPPPHPIPYPRPHTSRPHRRRMTLGENPNQYASVEGPDGRLRFPAPENMEWLPMSKEIFHLVDSAQKGAREMLLGRIRCGDGRVGGGALHLLGAVLASSLWHSRHSRESIPVVAAPLPCCAAQPLPACECGNSQSPPWHAAQCRRAQQRQQQGSGAALQT